MNVMHHVLRDYLHQFCIVYLDDILVYSRTWDEHQVHVRKVFDRLREQRLYASKEKSELGRTEVEFLGHKVSSKGIAVLDSKVEAIRNWKIPTSITEVRSFLGLANYYKFIEGYSAIAKTLTELTKKTQPWQ